MAEHESGGIRQAATDRCSQWATASNILLVIAAVFLIGTFCQVVFSAPNFAKNLMDIGVEFPELTQFCLSPYMPASLFALGALGVLNVVLVRNARLRLFLSATHLFLVLVLREIYARALFQPLIDLMKAMGQNGPPR